MRAALLLISALALAACGRSNLTSKLDSDPPSPWAHFGGGAGDSGGAAAGGDAGGGGVGGLSGGGGAGGDPGGRAGGGGGGAGAGGSGGGARPDGPIEEIGSCDPAGIPASCWGSDAESVALWCECAGDDCSMLLQRCRQGCNPITSGCEPYVSTGCFTCEQFKPSCVDSTRRSACQPDASGCASWVEGLPCAPGLACVGADCLPSCTVPGCDCPRGVEPACGENGLTYWNDCYRACAGVAAGAGCELDELVRVSAVPVPMRSFSSAGGSPPLLLGTPLLDWAEPAPGFGRTNAYRLDGAGALTELWSDPYGPGYLVAAAELPDGRQLAIGTSVGVLTIVEVSSSGVTRVLFRQRLDEGTISSPNLTLLRTEAELLFLIDGLLLSLDLVEPVPPRFEVLDPWFSLHAPLSSTGFLFPDRPVFVGGTERDAIVWEVTRGSPRLRFLWRSRLPGGDYVGLDGAAVWPAREGSASVAFSAREQLPSGVEELFLYSWDGGCMQVGPLLELETGNTGGSSSQDRSVAAGDLDGDGQPELVWLTRSSVTVLGRDGGGAPVLRARFELPGLADGPALHVLDGDGDGRAEVWISYGIEAPDGSPPDLPILRLVPRSSP